MVLTGKRPAIHHRHAHIQHNHGWSVLSKVRQGGHTVLCRDDPVALIFEGHGYTPLDTQIILYDQHHLLPLSIFLQCVVQKR